MKQEIAEKWVAALRSGAYRQGRNALRNSDNEFCCLGVLCNLHAQAHPQVAAREKYPEVYLDCKGVLPTDVMAWAGIRSRLGKVHKNGELTSFQVGGREWTALADANDGGCTFAQIASYIDKNWEHL